MFRVSLEVMKQASLSVLCHVARRQLLPDGRELSVLVAAAATCPAHARDHSSFTGGRREVWQWCRGEQERSRYL